MRRKRALIAVALLTVGFGAGHLSAGGSLDSPASPSDAVGQMVTLEQIYDLLTTGTTTEKMSAFTDPTSGPASTMHTLDDIMMAAQGNRCHCLCTGCTLHGTRWCDNGDGTVTDLTTCLVWLKDADCAGWRPWADTTAPDATRFDSALSLAGRLYDGSTEFGGGDCGLTDGSTSGDWRLPTKSELYDLTHGVDPVRKPSYPPAFTNVMWSRYWSSSVPGGDYKANAWYLEFSPAPPLNEVSFWIAAKGCIDDPPNAYVWPVRGGQ